MASASATITVPTLGTAPRAVFLARAMNAVLSLQQNLSHASLAEAAGASTDYMVLVNALLAAPIADEVRAEDPLAPARLRGAEMKKQLLLDAGGLMSSREVAETLGLTRQAVDKRRAQKRLIGLVQGKRGYAYPRFQFDDGAVIEGLEEVLGALDDANGWSQLIFFVGPNDFLDGCSPAHALREGRIEEVKRAARTYGEQGAR